MIISKVTELHIYPLKSCQGISLGQVKVNPKGLSGDREFMLVNKEGKFLSQRQYPQLATIQVKFVHDLLQLSVKDNHLFSFKSTLTGKEIEVEIWGDRCLAIDQGEKVSQWFEKVLNIPDCRLVRQSPKYPRKVDSSYAVNRENQVSFADGYPLLLTATASLAELNRRLEETYSDPSLIVPMNRFRTNIVINTTESFIESTWKTIKIGQVNFTLVKPCSRCVITTTNQETGERNPLLEPLKTLASFRQVGKKIMFGENMIPLNTGVIQVGDLVEVEGLN
jgi:uncharacterized protein YcbX